MYQSRFKIALFLSVCVLLLFTSFTIFKTGVKTLPKDDSKLAKLKIPADFKAEHLYSPSDNGNGSWVAMTFDDKGRIIASDQYGSLFRLKIPAIGIDAKTEVEKLTIANDTLGMGYAHGLLYAFNSLYVMVNNSNNNKKFTKKSGLYRLQDTDNDDRFDKITLLKALVGDGEHGPHSILLSPDKQSLHVICGNHTDAPQLDAYRLPSNWQEDNLFPLIKDPRGHANDRMAPGGWVAKIDPEGKKWEMVSAGYRNAFDMAFNEVGDLFVYDADMEWDFGLPWYRPTRICHATSASEFGWRTGNSKWSATWPDNLPPVINIGQGSPTNLLHLKDAKFPAKYKSTLLAFDWSFGIIHAVHLKPAGATYTAEREEFLSGIPLPLTDGLIGPDGALYFLTGGRRLESDLYRVSYTGSENTAAIAAAPINDANALRRQLEAFHGETTNPAAVQMAWPHLKNPDRFVRYAARLAIEHQPVAEWQDKALSEKDPIIKTNALIALIRQNKTDLKANILNALNAIDYDGLAENQQIDVLRAYELAFLRFGKPDIKIQTNIFAKLNAKFPAKSAQLNRSLSKILIYLEAPGVVEKTLDLMAQKEDASNTVVDELATETSDLIMRNLAYGTDLAKMLTNTPPTQQTYYATMLSLAKTGWTPALQERYFAWFKNAFQYKGGNSYIGFIDRARKLALKNVPDNKKAYFDKLSGGDMLDKSGNDFVKVNYPKGPGKNWTVASALPLMDSLTGRDFTNGQSMYAATACKSCHAIKGEGGAVGPDLTQLSTRFTPKDMLEAIIEPNKTISDQYAATQYSLKNGNSLVGRLINEDANSYSISQNPFAPEVLTKIPKKNVVSAKYSTVSTMYPNLINSLNQNELKDLMAFLLAGGNDKHPVYQKK
jgi:putative heme-binding domain-containing protein